MSTLGERISENVSKLSAQLDMLMVTLNKLDEIVNGTAKTGGLKERIAIAEQDIQKNKQSFDTIDKNITELRNEMLIEVGKIASAVNQPVKDKRDFITKLWQGALTAAAAAIVVAVTGIIFWQFITWLAAHAPIK